MLKRRDFLRTGIASSLLLSSRLRGAPTDLAAGHRPTAPGQARNLVFLVADGMSLGTLALTERYLQVHHGRSSHWMELYRRPGVRRVMVDTSSASSLVTDSAAASSAWGCGHKVPNGSINVTRDGQPHPPLLRLVRESGRATGLVTTSRVTDATPAGFAAQVASRVDEIIIARQYLDLGIDVLFGGGGKIFDPKLNKDGTDLLGAYRRAGYQLVRDRDGLLAAPATGPLLGLFSHSYLPLTLDRRANPAPVAAVPELAEMTRIALQRLALNPRGFALQVEGALVDKCAHANDVGGLIHEQIAFDDAVSVALEFAASRDDTLVIVTTDHACGNPGLNGTGGSFNSRGGSYGDTAGCFDRLVDFKQTNAWVLAGLTPDSTLPEIRERVQAANGIGLLDDECDILRRALRKELDAAYRVQNQPNIALGQILANYTSVGWAGKDHTTDFVELAAFGPGSEVFGSFAQNSDVFGVATRALGVGVHA